MPKRPRPDAQSNEAGCDRQAAFDQLCVWLKSHGARGLDNLALVQQDAAGDECGLVTVNGIKPGESIAVLPKACALTLKDARESPLGRALVRVAI